MKKEEALIRKKSHLGDSYKGTTTCHDFRGLRAVGGGKEGVSH